MRKNLIVGLAFVCSVVNFSALASVDDRQNRQMERFLQADTNKDGTLDMGEFVARDMRAEHKRRFEALDTDNDNKLSESELVRPRFRPPHPSKRW